MDILSGQICVAKKHLSKTFKDFWVPTYWLTGNPSFGTPPHTPYPDPNPNPDPDPGLDPVPAP